jgi:hypothetical protein
MRGRVMLSKRGKKRKKKKRKRKGMGNIPWAKGIHT